MSDIPCIDPEAIANLKELNPDDNGEFLREIIAIYLEDTPKRLAELKAFLASNDTAGVTRTAHTIKGSSANVGASRVRAVSERMEHISKQSGLAGLQSLLADCESAFKEAEEALKKIGAAG